MTPGLFVTDDELIALLGVPESIARVCLQELDKHPGFPKKLKAWGGRRYWPKVRAYLDQVYGGTIPSPVRRVS